MMGDSERLWQLCPEEAAPREPATCRSLCPRERRVGSAGIGRAGTQGRRESQPLCRGTDSSAGSPGAWAGPAAAGTGRATGDPSVLLSVCHMH